MKSRKELYAAVKKYNLQDKIKKYEGKNYTMCTNSVLLSYIDAYEVINIKPKGKVGVRKVTKLDKLIEVLNRKHILLKSEIDYINK